MKKLFHNLRHGAQPSDEFRVRLWQRLDAQAAPVLTHKPWYKRMTIPALASAALILFGGSGYAYAAPSVTPEHPLYGIKSGIERVEGGVHFSAEGRAKFHERMAQRRAKELKHANRADTHVRLRGALIERLNLSEEELIEIKNDPEARAELKARIEAFKEEHREEIEEHMRDMQARIQEQRQNALEHVNELEAAGTISAEQATEIRTHIEQGGPINFLNRLEVRSETDVESDIEADGGLRLEL